MFENDITSASACPKSCRNSSALFRYAATLLPHGKNKHDKFLKNLKIDSQKSESESQILKMVEKYLWNVLFVIPIPGIFLNI